MTTEQDWGVRDPVLLAMYFIRISNHVFQHSSILGSLIRPKEQALEFVNADIPRDPPEFREWIVEQWLQSLGDC